MNETKICKRCLRVWPLEEFHRHCYNRDYHANICKTCYKEEYVISRKIDLENIDPSLYQIPPLPSASYIKIMAASVLKKQTDPKDLKTILRIIGRTSILYEVYDQILKWRKPIT
jgi:hypothetical protein